MTDRLRITAYTPNEPVWREIKEHYGLAGDSEMVNLLITNEVRRMHGDNTKELRLERVEDAIRRIEAKMDMALYVAWAAYVGTQGTTVKFSAEQARELRGEMQKLLSD